MLGLRWKGIHDRHTVCDVVDMESSGTLVARGLTKVFRCQTGKTSLDQFTCHVCRTQIAGRKQVQTTEAAKGVCAEWQKRSREGEKVIKKRTEEGILVFPGQAANT